MAGEDEVLSFDDVDLEDSSEASEEVNEEQSSEEAAPSEETKLELETKDEEVKEEVKEEIKIEKIEISDSLKEKGISQDEEGNLGLTYKTDGEDKFIKLEDLKSHEAGQTKWDQKISEASEIKKEVEYSKSNFEREKAVFQGNATKFVDAVNKSDSDGAINALAALANTDALSLRSHFVELMEGQARAYWKMSDEERITFDKDEQIKYYKQNQEMQNEQSIANAEYNEVQRTVTDFQLKYKMDDRTLVAVHDEIIKSGKEISLEALETQHLVNVSQGKALSILEKIDPTLKDSGYVDQVGDFIRQNPDISDEEVIESINLALDQLKQEDMKEADSKKQVNSKTPLQKKMSKNSKGSTGEESTINTDDLDDIIEFDDVDLDDMNF